MAGTKAAETGARPNPNPPTHPTLTPKGRKWKGERNRCLKVVGRPYKSPSIQSSKQETGLEGLPESQWLAFSKGIAPANIGTFNFLA